MSQNRFREKAPERTYKGPEKSSHRAYKEELIKDFNSKCGYTDTSHFWYGGKSNFHIDHFAPKSEFPDLSTKYSNLVYCCSYVNRAKSNDWPSESPDKPVVDGEGYLDPCEVDYNEYFYRDSEGNIKPYSDKPVAKYMYKELKLYLKRYSIIWKLEQLKKRIDKLRELMPDDTNDADKEVLVIYTELNNEFQRYLDYLAINQ